MFLSPGNCNLVYAIIRKRNVFHQLANLPSDPSSIQKALQRKKKSPDVISRTSSQETVSMEGSHPAVPAEPGTLKASLVAMPGNESTCCLYGNVVISKQSIHCVVVTAHITYIFAGHIFPSEVFSFFMAQIQKRWGKHFSEILIHIDMTPHSYCTFMGCKFMMRISCSTTLQRCSIGLRSGDCGGHSNTVNSLSSSKNRHNLRFVTWSVILLEATIRRLVHWS